MINEGRLRNANSAYNRESAATRSSSMQQNKQFQDQLDEMAALESYFVDDPKCFQYISDYPEVHGYVILKIPRSGKPIKLRAFAMDFEQREASVRYLPPVKVFFSLPSDYPSNSAPEYTLMARWWTREIKHDVEERLKVVCDDFCGLPLILACIEAIKEQVLESLAKNDHIIDMDSVDAQGTSGYQSLQGLASSSSKGNVGGFVNFQILLQAVSYDERTSLDHFEREFFECAVGFVVSCHYRIASNVCGSTKIGKECARFMPCEHVFCKECINAFYQEQLTSSAVKQLCCMATGCDSEAAPSLLRSLLSSDQFERYERLLFEKNLEKMDDAVRCPRPSCQSVVIVSPTEQSHSMRVASKLATCPVCDFSFCINCGKAYHALAPCQTVSERSLKLLYAFEHASDTEREAMYRCMGGKRQLDNKIQQMMSERWMLENEGKHCPWCSTYVLKDYGCDHMHCTKCDNDFCWRCGGRLEGRRWWKHFGRSGYSCRGERNAQSEGKPYI
ncbi:unnamed protein product [Toxocara canis]|uniref:RBR-type E3 ubiquitin transferase n=1 Tax=Toxocara canis TaxID=6265 RepID=A0A183UN37_TOXCA|nr:unnamed protein product [Toxocara canis]